MRHIIGVNLFPTTWLLLGPYALPHLTNTAVKWNDGITGLVIAGCTLALLRDAALPWVWRTAAMAAGVWLIVSPFLLPYPAGRSGGDVLAGCLILIVSLFETLEATHHGLA